VGQRNHPFGILLFSSTGELPVFRSLFGKNGVDEYDFGTRVVAIRTRKEVTADRGGYWFHRVKIRRLGDQLFFTGEVCDSPEGTENPYKGVVFWYLLSEIEQMREYTSMVSAVESWQACQRLLPKKEQQSGD
jgi:hypothetical protein